MRRPATASPHRTVVAAVTVTTVLWALTVGWAVPHLGDEAGSTHVWVDGGALLGVSVATHVDHLAAVLMILAASVALLVQVFSTAYLRGDPRYRSYAWLVVLFELAMLTVVVADDLFVLLVGWEVMGLCSYLLIGHHWELAPARAGAVKAFVITRLGDLGLLIAIFVLGATAGSFRISVVLEQVRSGAATGDLTVAGLLLLCAVVGKSAQFPLHTWLPDAMPGPTPISALIHAATMVAAGVFLVARLYPVFAASSVTMTVLALIACVTMLLAALFALAQTDLKRVLAWSTVSQLAYMFAAMAVGGTDAGIDHLLSHGSFKALLFLAAGCVAHAVGSTTLTSLGGLRTAMPITFATATVGFAALAGVAPTSGFLSKDAVLEAAAHATGHTAPVAAPTAWLVLVVGLVTAFVTVVYATRTWLLVFFGPHEPRAEAHDSPAAMTGPLLLLAVATVALGPIVPWHPAMALVSTAIAAVGIAGTVAYWGRGHDPADLLGRTRPLFARELYVDDAYDRLAGAVGRTGDLAVGTDRDVIDAYPRGTVVAAETVARWLERLQAGNVQTYAAVFSVGAVLLVLAAVVAG